MSPAPIAPAVLVRQADTLAADLRDPAAGWAESARALPGSLWGEVERVVFIGSGDSHHAGLAAAALVEAVAGVDCDAVPSLAFCAADGGRTRRRRTLAVAVSASGGTEQVVRAVEQAREWGARTLAITGRSDSPLANLADHALTTAIPDPEPSPGIRTHQASLVGLLLVGLELARARGVDVSASLAELERAPEAVEAAAEAARDRADLVDLVADAPALAVAGSGPALGSAHFTAAKLVEAAGLPAHGVDVEEWCHVERFTRPSTGPVLLLAPPGRSRHRADVLVAKARAQGRPVAVVAAPADRGLAGDAPFIALPTLREEFSPW
ncbi:SIS domain-containing protein [Actinokineospora sp. G85]|uniref:SIS domain-containing protein n=1 Tax=Actinokineospora sp. G85 TaxID=3406626 RepID=UPI003C75387B